MAYTAPAISDFKTQFFRDFPYQPTGEDTDLAKVQDQDITNGLNMAAIHINTALFDTQAIYAQAYLLLAAHYLVTSLRNSSQGLAGQYAWLQTSKGAGSVSESFQVPQRILDNPYLSMLAKTRYGALYLELIAPLLVGQVFASRGCTQA